MLKQRISKSQIEAFLIILFLLTLIAITPPDLKTITGKQYGSCGDGTCNIDEDKYNCPQDCEVAPETPVTPTYVPPTPTCDLSKQYCLYQAPPKDFDSVNCKCIPFSYCADIPNYEICSSEQHCPQQNQLAYETTDGLSNKCCQKEKCEAGRLCSPSSPQGGSCRTNGYIGASCTRYVQNTEIKGICENDPTGLNYCVCWQTTTSTAPTVPECSEGDKICETALVRKFCLNKVWRTESCPYGCENGRCKTFLVPLKAVETCPSDAGPCADVPLGTTCFTSEGAEGICNENCQCVLEECSEGASKCKDRYTVLVCKDGKWDIEYCEKAERCESGECIEQRTYHSKDKENCLKYPGKYKWDEYRKVCECLPDLKAQCKTGKYYSKEIGAEVIDLREWVPYQYGDGTDCECKCQDYAESTCGLKKPGEWVFDYEKCICIPKYETCEGIGEICAEDEECLCGAEKEIYSALTHKTTKCCTWPGHCGETEPSFKTDKETIDKTRLLFAAKLIDIGRIEHAKAILQDLIQSDSIAKGKAQAALSFALVKEGNFQEALAQAQQAIKSDPKEGYITETTNNVFSAVFKIMISSIGQHSTAISKAYAEQMHTEGIKIDPELYTTAPEEVVFLRFKQLHEGLVDLGMRGAREGYYSQDYLSSFEKAQNDLALRGTTVLTLSALLKQRIPFNLIVSVAKNCNKGFCSKCSELDYYINQLPPQNIKSFYNELQTQYKISPSALLAGFLTQDRDGILLSQYGTPEAVAEGTFRFEDPSSVEEAIPSDLRAMRGQEVLENIFNAETLLVALVPQTQITTIAGEGVTLSQVVSQATGIANVAAYMKPWQRFTADLAIAFGLSPALEAAGADPAAAKKLAMIAAIFSPFSSGGNLRQLETLDKFGDNFIKAVDDEIFGKIIATDTAVGVIDDFNSQLKNLLNKEGFSSLASARGALAEALAKAQPGILTSEDIAQKVFANLDDIVNTALKNTLAEVAPGVLRKFLTEKAYCSFAPEPLPRKPPESVIPSEVYDEKAAAEIVEKGEYVYAGAYGKTYTGKLLISPDDIASGKVKFLTDLTPDELQTALKQGVIIKIPSQPIQFTEEREITEKAIADLKKEIQIYTEIAKKAPEIGTPRPLLEIKKFDPATGLEYSELVMTAIKNPAGTYHIEGPRISVTIGDIFNNRIHGEVYLAPDAYEDFARKIKTLHEKVKIAQNDLHFNNILVTSEGKLVPIDFGRAVSQSTYSGPAVSTWQDEAAQFAWEAALREDDLRLQLLQNEIRKLQGKLPIPLQPETELQNTVKKAIDEAFYFSSTPSQCPLK